MHAQCARQTLIWKALSTLRTLFARYIVPGIALLVVVVILCTMLLTTQAPATHTHTSVGHLIAGEGPGNGPPNGPPPTPTP